MHVFGQLLLLAIPVACIAWTVTHEEIFKELREWLKRIHDGGIGPSPVWPHLQRRHWSERLVRKLAYMPTCEYCFSHYVALGVLGLCQASGYRTGATGVAVWLLDWLTIVWVANLYMNLHFRLRLSIRKAGADARFQELHNAEMAKMAERDER